MQEPSAVVSHNPSRVLTSAQIQPNHDNTKAMSTMSRVVGTVLTPSGLHALERGTAKIASRARIFTNFQEFRAGRKDNFANKHVIGWEHYDIGRKDMEPLYRDNPTQFRELQTESLRVPVEAQMEASAVDAPKTARNAPFSHARADFLKVPPKDAAKPNEQIFVLLEPNGAGSAAYEAWSPVAQAAIQDAAYVFGERMVAKGPNARVLVLSSGSSALPKTFDQVKTQLEGQGTPPEDITRAYVKEQGITTLEDIKEKPGYEGSYDQKCIETMGRMPPTAFSQEKTFGVSSGVAAAMANKFGQSEVNRIPFVPNSTDPFRDNHPDNFHDNYRAQWDDPQKASVMVMQMDDGIRNESIEIRYEGSQNEATGGTLYVEGHKVDGVYNDGGFAQLMAAYQARYDADPANPPMTFKLDSRATELCNDTLPMAENKFQSTCLHNDFMKIYGHLYPSVVQSIPAYYCAGQPQDMLAAAKRLHAEGLPVMPKADKSRWGRGVIDPIQPGTSDDEILAACKKSKDDVDNTINASGAPVAGQAYCMMQGYERSTATFAPDDKRAALNGAFVEVNVLTVADHSPKYDYKEGGFKFKSHVPIAKLTFETTANLSTNVGGIPAHLRTLPMHEDAMLATHVSSKQCQELSNCMSHMWAFFEANRDLYQHNYRTSASEPALRTPTRVAGPAPVR